MTVIDWRNLPPRDGFELSAQKVYDADTRPSDFDCYTPKQVAAWERDGWDYVGLVVTATIAGIDLGQSSLWSIENGRFPITDENDILTETRDCDPLYDDDYLEGLITEAIAAARENLAAINAKVAQ